MLLNAADRVVAQHAASSPGPVVVAIAPGRVNLIGEHTDYNDGFVLPIALPFTTAVAMSASPPGSGCRVVSAGFGHTTLSPDATVQEPADWAGHIRGVQQLLAQMNIDPGPWTATIDTDIPVGASLSSSAALEVAVANAILHLAGLEWSPINVARLGQRVENELLGVPSGIMDQLISATAVVGHASLIDCRSLESTLYRLPESVTVAILDTGTRRELINSEFAQRRETCRRASEQMGLDSLRDATFDDLDKLPAGETLERRRARHVLSENARVLQAAAALEANDPVALGQLMTASHRSLRDDFEVSSAALDEIVGIAKETDGCLGARMTGGGFAGCAVALVQTEKAEQFCSTVEASYRTTTKPARPNSALDGDVARPQVWLCHPARGAWVKRIE